MNRHIARAYVQFACFLLARFPREAAAVQIAKALYGASLYLNRVQPKDEVFKLFDATRNAWARLAPGLVPQLLGLDGVVRVLKRLEADDARVLRASEAVPDVRDTLAKCLLSDNGRALLDSEDESERAVGAMFMFLLAVSNNAPEGAAESNDHTDAVLTPALETLRARAGDTSPHPPSPLKDTSRYARALVLEYVRRREEAGPEVIYDIVEQALAA